MVLYGETKDVHATSSWPNELERGIFSRNKIIFDCFHVVVRVFAAFVLIPKSSR